MTTLVIKDKAIPKDVADAACRSLDKEIARKRGEGALEAGKKSSVKLEWTKETQSAVRAFESAHSSANLAPIASLGGNPAGKVGFAGPIVYSDVSTEPMRFPSSILGVGIMGIIALGTLHLPEFGDSGPTVIESGSIAYFRDSSPVTYRACGGGRGILFFIN
jgi:hypothetical protein